MQLTILGILGLRLALHFQSWIMDIQVVLLFGICNKSVFLLCPISAPQPLRTEAAQDVYTPFQMYMLLHSSRLWECLWIFIRLSIKYRRPVLFGNYYHRNSSKCQNRVFKIHSSGTVSLQLHESSAKPFLLELIFFIDKKKSSLETFNRYTTHIHADIHTYTYIFLS